MLESGRKRRRSLFTVSLKGEEVVAGKGRKGGRVRNFFLRLKKGKTHFVRCGLERRRAEGGVKRWS